MQKITTFLTFNNEAEEALNLYASIFKNSKIIGTNHYPDSFPGMGGQFMTGTLEIEGQQFYFLNGGPSFKFEQGISLFITCKTQEEIDHYWDKLSEGGETLQCGWLKDKFGISWQVVPEILSGVLNGKEPEKSGRAFQAMLQMTKFDIDSLQKAYDGKL